MTNINVLFPRTIAAVATANAALAPGALTPVDASASNRTMTLPAITPNNNGAVISVQKVDSSANQVLITGNLRGITSSLTLLSQYESITLIADANGSWWPTEGHRTKLSLDALYGTNVRAPGTVAMITANSSGVYALRNTVASSATDTSVVIWWAGPTQPTVGGGYMLSGTDWWIQTT